MKLSVVIVNYNVKYFIEQCLHSVAKAIDGIECEVFVVDNNSVDGSCALIKEKFPWVKLIENTKNTGFSVANNQAIRLSQGEYVLLLNPDTVVQESTFHKVISFMDARPDAGGLGVKMIDGRGNFLPESKRGVPTPLVAFYKIFGLSKLFPKSKRFSKYHLGYLDKEQTHEIEILSGAFMFMRKSVLDKVGLLDEDYFMYGEDIDLSYRIIKGGYKNYYYPETTIIHYKGESTKKGSINYVLVFYKAMIIFARKQLDQQNARLFSFLINIAIYFRAFLSIIKRFVHQSFLPVVDASIIIGGFWLVSPLWAQLKFNSETAYSETFFQYIVPVYALIWLVALYFSGAYEKPVKLFSLFRGIITGLLLVLFFYGLLDEQHRFSRFLIFAGALWALLCIPLVRYLIHKSKFGDFRLFTTKTKRVVLVGELAETNRISTIIKETGLNPNIIGCVSLHKNKADAQFIGDISQIDEIIAIYKIDEIIFCLKDVTANEIINQMHKLSDLQVDFKIAPPEAVSIIGSNSIDTAGELYTLEINTIAKKLNKQKKRIVDIGMAFLLLVLYPIFAVITKRPISLVHNIFLVLVGRKTWVSYNPNSEKGTILLPRLKKGIIFPLMEINALIPQSTIEHANIVYAKNYNIVTDIILITKNLKFLGNNKT